MDEDDHIVTMIEDILQGSDTAQGHYTGEDRNLLVRLARTDVPGKPDSGYVIYVHDGPTTVTYVKSMPDGSWVERPKHIARDWYAVSPCGLDHLGECLLQVEHWKRPTWRKKTEE